MPTQQPCWYPLFPHGPINKTVPRVTGMQNYRPLAEKNSLEKMDKCTASSKLSSLLEVLVIWWPEAD